MTFLFAFQPSFIHFYVQLAHSAAGGVGFGAGRLSVYSMNDKNSDWSHHRCRNWRRIGSSHFLDYLLVSRISGLVYFILFLGLSFEPSTLTSTLATSYTICQLGSLVEDNLVTITTYDKYNITAAAKIE
jgi:hypothetical protein